MTLSPYSFNVITLLILLDLKALMDSMDLIVLITLMTLLTILTLRRQYMHSAGQLEAQLQMWREGMERGRRRKHLLYTAAEAVRGERVQLKGAPWYDCHEF